MGPVTWHDPMPTRPWPAPDLDFAGTARLA